MEPKIYFIKEGDNGPIKVGLASNVQSRLSALQTGNSHTLALVGSYPGTYAEEYAAHEALADYRVRGEWYSSCPEALEIINNLIAFPPTPDQSELDRLSAAQEKRGPGRPKGTHPPPKWVERLTIKLPSGGKDELERRARGQRCSVSELVRRVLGMQ